MILGNFGATPTAFYLYYISVRASPKRTSECKIYFHKQIEHTAFATCYRFYRLVYIKCSIVSASTVVVQALTDQPIRSIILAGEVLATINYRIYRVLITLIALIAPIFTVAFLAGGDNSLVDYSVKALGESSTTEDLAGTASTFETAFIVNPGKASEMTFVPWETDSPDSKSFVPVRSLQNGTEAYFRAAHLPGLQ